MSQDLQVIYAKVPKMSNCRPGCTDCCGSIGMTFAEFRNLMGREPQESEKCEGYATLAGKDGSCPMVNPITGRCSAYERRPLICRLYGVVLVMTCPHGCRPERWLSDEEALELIRQTVEAGKS